MIFLFPQDSLFGVKKRRKSKGHTYERNLAKKMGHAQKRIEPDVRLSTVDLTEQSNLEETPGSLGSRFLICVWEILAEWIQWTLAKNWCLLCPVEISTGDSPDFWVSSAPPKMRNSAVYKRASEPLKREMIPLMYAKTCPPPPPPRAREILNGQTLAVRKPLVPEEINEHQLTHLSKLLAIRASGE